MISNGKFFYPNAVNSFKNYVKLNPKYAKIVKFNQELFDIKTMQFGKYDGGFIDHNLKYTDFEIPVHENLNYTELFVLYNNRIILNKNWDMFLLNNNKFYYNISIEQLKNYIKLYPQYSKIVQIKQELFDIKAMQFGIYDGGFYKE